jgi:soluble lytic murein transglycosylase-like protein
MSDLLQPMGPEAIRARMQEIQGKMAQVFGQPQSAQGGPTAFTGMLGMTGAITADGTKPMNPFGDGSGLIGKPTPTELKGKIAAAAQAHGVDPALLDAIVQAESGYDTTAVSKVGARGLTQLMPQTAMDMGVRNPNDPDQNLQGGAKYLSGLLKQFPKMEDAVAAYNAGPGAVVRAGGIPNYPETQGYVQKVMALYRENRR